MSFNHLLTMTSNHPSSNPSKIDTLQYQQFDYGNIDIDTKLSVEQRTTEIKSLIRQTAQDIVSIGQKLTEVKGKLKHGSFRNWLKSEFNWSLSSATKFMQVSEQFKDVNFNNLNFSTSALYILAAPSTPSKARQQALQLASHGEQITYSLAKMIVNRHKDTDTCNSHQLLSHETTKSAVSVGRELSEPQNSQLERDTERWNTTPTTSVDVAAQTIVSEEVVESNYSEEQNTARLEAEGEPVEVADDRPQNFKITYAGISFTIKGKPKEITTLFEQMQSNANFAREVFAKAQLLVDSDTDCKTIK